MESISIEQTCESIRNRLVRIYEKYHAYQVPNRPIVLGELRAFMEIGRLHGAFYCDIHSKEFLPVYDAIEKTCDEFINKVIQFADPSIKSCFEDNYIFYEEDECG